MLPQLFTNFAAGGHCAEKSFFGLVPWYHYLNLDSTCEIPKSFVNQLFSGNSPLLLILIAVIDDLLRIAGLVAVGFVIYGGIQFIMSQGSPDQTSKAQNTIVNALVGLAIALIGVALVSFIGNQIGG